MSNPLKRIPFCCWANQAVVVCCFAQSIHDRNPELSGRFTQLRCDTLSAVNAHRELYGEETAGAVSMGFLESAAGGTLFLTDVELLPPNAQQCLRQAIEQQGFMRVGSNNRVPFRCRMVGLIAAGSFIGDKKRQF